MIPSPQSIDITNSSQSFLVSFYYLFIYFVVRTLNMRSAFLTNFEEHNIISLRHCAVQQVSRTYSSNITETLYPLNNNSPIPPTPRPGVFNVVDI